MPDPESRSSAPILSCSSRSASHRSSGQAKAPTHVATKGCLLGGIGLANLLEQFEVRRLPSHHALLLVCRQVCAHPVDVELQPRAALADRFHLVVSLQHQADFGNFHLLRIASALFGEIAED